jgi:two-component system, OmpR family, sensor kinase
MKLSIRSRLTLWYSGIVVAVLVTGAAVAWVTEWELTLERLDDDLARSMATLEGVMRTEFGEGLTLEGAAEEASIEVVVPDRTLLLQRPDGTLLEIWGLKMDPAFLPALVHDRRAVTLATQVGDLRVLRHQVEHAGHRYRAAIIAPLAPVHAQQIEMLRAMSAGVMMALLLAAAGGWVIGWQTLKPLAVMADQARRINERDPRERLEVPAVADELGRLAAAFNGLLDRLASALNSQRQFMADASHELRTPVSVVRTATQVTMSRDVRSAEEYRESLVIIGEEANRLSRLVDSMFLLSRAEAQGVLLQPEFLNLDDVLAECTRALGVLARQRGVSLTTAGDEEVGFTGDDALLRQMIGNLLDNAIRHAEMDGRVTASLERSNGSVILRFTNDGPGIEPASQKRIFDRFFRIGVSDGAGLGLPIARWIAEAHGGTLELAGSTRGSTTFLVTLPIDHAERSGAQWSTPRESVGPASTCRPL